jgi:hypothetical protein
MTSSLPLAEKSENSALPRVARALFARRDKNWNFDEFVKRETSLEHAEIPKAELMFLD